MIRRFLMTDFFNRIDPKPLLTHRRYRVVATAIERELDEFDR